MGLDQPGPSLGIGEFLSIGSYNLVCILVGMGLGWWGDASAGSTPVLTLGGLAGGVALGVAGTWRRILPLLTDEGVGGSRTTDGEPPGPH